MSEKLKNEKLPKEYGRHYDYKLLIIVIILTCFGFIMIYSSSAYTAALEKNDAAYFVKRQMGISVLTFIAMIIISKVDYHFWLKFTIPIYILALIFMVLVDFTSLGVEVNGKKRWLQLISGEKFSIFRFQPTELVKIAIIMSMAILITGFIKEIDQWQTMALFAAICFLPFILVTKNNLSSGIIIAGIAIVMYFVASRRKVLFGIGVGAVVVILFVAYTCCDLLEGLLHGYQMSRIEVWIDPLSDPTDKGYQVLQGLYAIGSGGLLGKGLGNSVQKLGFLPESYNDMVFSVICEELGLFGATCLMLLFGYMIYRFVYIALRAPDLQGTLLVVGAMAHISIQVVLNIAVVTNSIPNTGVTLPFISYGGTSVLFLMAEMGLVLSVSNQIVYKK